MAQNPEVNSCHCAITMWKTASVGEIPNHQSRCKPRTGPKMAPPDVCIILCANHPSVALILALRRIARSPLMGKVCDQGI